jgi:amino acid transporter
MTIAGSQCGAELAAMLPQAGGQYVFLREAYGPAPAFLFGWALFLIIQTGKIAAVAVAFATFSGVVIPWISVDHYLLEPIAFGRYAVSLSTQQLVAVSVILLLTAVNTRGLHVGKRIHNTLTIVKTAALLAMIVLGLTAGWDGDGALWSSSWWDSPRFVRGRRWCAALGALREGWGRRRSETRPVRRSESDSPGRGSFYARCPFWALPNAIALALGGDPLA